MFTNSYCARVGLCAYFTARSSFTDVAKVGRLMSALTMTVDSDGYLVSSSDGDPVRWRQIEPLLFQQVDGKRRIAFRQNDREEITDFCASPLCIVTMQKQPWWESVQAQRWSLGLCLGLLAGGLVGLPIAAIRQRKQPNSALSKVARQAAWLTCLTWGAGFGFFLSKMPEMQRVVFGPTSDLKLVLNIWAAAALLTIVPICMLFPAWRQRWWRPAGRICFTLLALAAVGCILWLNHWNLLGWKY